MKTQSLQGLYEKLQYNKEVEKDKKSSRVTLPPAMLGSNHWFLALLHKQPTARASRSLWGLIK